jgi:N6-L-threonylcarbamoyladenine synthase
MRILGIETSCDETAAAVVEDRRLLSSVVLSQTVHGDFGGVVPEIASRAHIRAIVPIVVEALERSGTDVGALDGVAVTVGPGLIGSLIVGVAFAKSLCFATGRPLVAVDHVQSHVAANYVAFGDLEEPFLCLVISGGHTHLFLVDSPLSMRLVGSTQDDAAGEAFDKVARMLGLRYPGGPEIEREAAKGDPGAIDFPRPLLQEGYGFSFSGLKTAVKYFIDRHQGEVSPGLRADIAAGFQQAVSDVLVEKTLRAARDLGVGAVSAVGGVASNAFIRENLERGAHGAGIRTLIPPPELCTDNAAIVAMSGFFLLRSGRVSALSVCPYSTRSYARL